MYHSGRFCSYRGFLDDVQRGFSILLESALMCSKDLLDGRLVWLVC